MTLQTADMVLTCAADTVLVFGLGYFTIAFVVFVWQVETATGQAMQLATVQDRLTKVKSELNQVDADIALTERVLPRMQQERTALSAEIAARAAEDALGQATLPMSTEHGKDDDVIATSDVPSNPAPVEPSGAVELPYEPVSPLPLPGAVYRGVPLNDLGEFSLVVPAANAASDTSVNASTLETVNYGVNADSNRSDDVCANGSGPLPVIARSSLKIWTGRHKKKVVPLHCLPESLVVPGSVQRLRWRSSDVIHLADLERLVMIV